MISRQRYLDRREQLKQVLRDQKLTTLLVCDSVNVRYLTGFTGDSSWLLLSDGRDQTADCILSDGRFTTQLAEECPDLAHEIRPVSQTLIEATVGLLGQLKRSDCGFESTALSYDQARLLLEAASGVSWLPVKNLVEPLRAIKDDDEIAAIREAIVQAEQGFLQFKSLLQRDMTELEVAFALENCMRQAGALRASFEVIAAVGPRAALPHARPGTARCREAAFLLVDWGALSPTGYISDLTRMIVTDSISPKFQSLYEVVKTAQEQAIAAIAPGVTACEVDRIARNVMEQAGVADKFNHSLGHGIGLQVHEAIRLGPSSQDVLRPGMVVTVEPGVYFPGWGGIRIEDDVLVTADGYEILSSLPKELESCQVIC